MKSNWSVIEYEDWFKLETKSLLPYVLPNTGDDCNGRFYKVIKSKGIFFTIVWLDCFFKDWETYYKMFFEGWITDKHPESENGGIYLQESEIKKFILIISEFGQRA